MSPRKGRLSLAFGMKKRNQFAGKRISVIGCGRTGRSTAAVLEHYGAKVTLSDQATADRLGDDYELARMLPVRLVTGATPEQALDGAEIVVPSPGVPRYAPVLVAAQERRIPILSEIEIAYRIARCPILAVTGTNGKSTTVVWLAQMLGDSGFHAHIAGNIASDDIECVLIDAAEAAAEDDVIVAEVSSFQLEWVEQFRPKIGILTNIRVDHLDRHASFAEYAGCKARLFAAQTPEDIAIFNAVNAPSRAIASNVRSRVVWFDRGYCGADEWAGIRDQYLTVRLNGREHRLVHVDELGVRGKHNQENALAASAAAIAYGADPEAVCNALRSFRGLYHRMELVAESGGVAFINSSMTTNVDAAIHVLETIERPVVLIAGGYPKNQDFTLFGRAIAKYVSHAVLMGTAARDIEEAARAAGFYDTSRADDMEDAVRQAMRRARPGDAVVLAPACASKDMFRGFQDRGRAFRNAVMRIVGEPSLVRDEAP